MTAATHGSDQTAILASAPGTLRWAIKRSFRGYISALEDGSEAGIGVTLTEDEYEFPGDSIHIAPDGRRIFVKFQGAVAFDGYGGLLAITFAQPWLELDGDRVTLTVEDALTGGVRHAIARFTLAPALLDAPTGVVRWNNCSPELTFEGVRFFGDTYRVGAPLDHLSFYLTTAPPA
ncbi:HtaA domain-containing protein [Arthrobacter sp. AZCC_0090]|uniref:HtaA domain-containing protein n=1 Tax=Arthrobacter sp. AZCC_0090 TaxID=2735881 RepID=UPI001611BF20|nr:HtaA domain-containing protein [Arthrobacter sp. AZCC_0090]MBB6407155.1 hypothetical protein [Arthrobacter sp. AZCC_0090]